MTTPADERGGAARSRYVQMLDEARAQVQEVMPWDLPAWVEKQTQAAEGTPPLLLDVREPAEFAQGHIAGSINIPRGVLEQACEWDHDETEPQLARGRTRAIAVICRSGNRSVFAAHTLQQLGFATVISLKTGVRGWNDFDQPLVAGGGVEVDADAAAQRLAAHLRPDQRRPAG